MSRYLRSLLLYSYVSCELDRGNIVDKFSNVQAQSHDGPNFADAWAWPH
jgi:hypothetical protein